MQDLCWTVGSDSGRVGGLTEPKILVEKKMTVPEHLEDIVTRSHPSLGETGRRLLRDLLHRYEHVFPAPGSR